MPAQPLETTIAPPAFDPEMLGAIPGGEMLSGSNLPDIATEAEDDEETPDIDETETEEIGIGAETEAPDEEPEEEEKAEAKNEEKSEEEPATPEEKERQTWPESAQKRVDKLTAQKSEIERERDALKTEAETVKAELAAIKTSGPSPVLAPTPENPLAHVNAEKDLAAHVEFSQRMADWAIENLASGGILPPEIDAILTRRTPEQIAAEPRELEPKQVAALLKTANARLTRDIPQRQSWLRMDQQAQSYVAQHYPQMLKTDSEDGQLYARYERELPEIKKLPTWRVALVDLVRGARQRIAEETERAGQGAPAKAATAPKQPAQVPLAPPMPGAPRGAGARPAAAKPTRTVPLRSSMNAEEIAAAL